MCVYDVQTATASLTGMCLHGEHGGRGGGGVCGHTGCFAPYSAFEPICDFAAASHIQQAQPQLGWLAGLALSDWYSELGWPNDCQEMLFAHQGMHCPLC